jgi:hypothetical protein
MQCGAIEAEVVDALKKRYQINPLVFQRSCEYAASVGELFDILDTIPSLPFVWDQKRRRWITLDNVTVVKFPD